jgi:hypothetical protein
VPLLVFAPEVPLFVEVPVFVPVLLDDVLALVFDAFVLLTAGPALPFDSPAVVPPLVVPLVPVLEFVDVLAVGAAPVMPLVPVL